MGGNGVEIERKFIVAAPPAPEVLDAFGEPLHIDQRYLRSPRAGLTRRVRAMSTAGSSRFFYTEKEPLPGAGSPSGGAVVRAEREEEISAGRYRELCREADPGYRVVVKDRWRIPVGDLVFELDHVTAPVELWVLEVELDDPDAPVVVPPEFGAVREDPACSMAALARGTYPAPQHEETGHATGHAHWHPTHGVAFETVCALSMTFGRAAMARAVAELAGLSAADVVVDVGCGPGTAVRRARRTAGQVVGVDPSPQMLRLGRLLTAARRLDGVTYVEGAAESMPIETASATVVWAIQSAHHWRDPGRGLTEARRVLAPGGRLIVAERAVAPGARGHAAHGLTERQAAEWARLATDAGFEDVGTRPLRAGRRQLVAITASAPPGRS